MLQPQVRPSRQPHAMNEMSSNHPNAGTVMAVPVVNVLGAIAHD